jgi:hypothetical protein
MATSRLDGPIDPRRAKSLVTVRRTAEGLRTLREGLRTLREELR